MLKPSSFDLVPPTVTPTNLGLRSVIAKRVLGQVLVSLQKCEAHLLAPIPLSVISFPVSLNYAPFIRLAGRSGETAL